MSFRLVAKSVTLNGVMAVTLRYLTEFGKPASICGGIYARVYCILCRSRHSLRSNFRIISGYPVFL